MIVDRTLDYDAFNREKQARFADLKARLGYRRGIRRRQRDPAELDSLMQLDIARLQEMYRTGERRWIAPRVIEVRL